MVVITPAIFFDIGVYVQVCAAIRAYVVAVPYLAGKIFSAEEAFPGDDRLHGLPLLFPDRVELI
jgi:hypothetical protein